jgi:hypothetical protein
VPRRKDIWRCGLIRQPVAQLLQPGALAGAQIDWIASDIPFTFLADPFGWHDGSHLHLFAEYYDYRTRHGIIEHFRLDKTGQILDRGPCLKEPWHLSYPLVFEGEGSVWMLPEAHRSGQLTLYRMGQDPSDWVATQTLALDVVPVDASPIYYAGRWWLFYAPATNKASKLGHLHVAWADRLAGPWTPHPANPVRIDPSSARPGGTPMLIGDRLMLPVQDCTQTYGGAIRPLWITRLDETVFEAEKGDAFAIPKAATPFLDGMHTLSACGDATFIDVKRIDTSARGLWLDFKRALGKFD